MELVSYMTKIANSFIKTYYSDFIEDCCILGQASARCEESGDPETYLWMCREHGSYLMPVYRVLEKGSFSYEVWTYPDYIQDPEHNRAFLIELNTEKHLERWGSGCVAYGTIKELDIQKASSELISRAYCFNTYKVVYKRAGQRFERVFPDVFIKCENKNSFENTYGKILSHEPIYTDLIQKKIADALTALRSRTMERQQ